MRILNLSYDDYANFAHENANALRSIGVECDDLKKVKHSFAYKTESKLADSDKIKRAIAKADVVQLFHSDSTWLDYCVSAGKRITVFHTGTNYRMNPTHLNSIFNGKAERCFTDQCEFIGLGMKNETYIATAIDTDSIKPAFWKTIKPFMAAHYPSNPGVKGSVKIIEMVKSIENTAFLYSDTIIKHANQLERMNNCDVYIELFNTKQNGKPYGCFGVTAFEAAALGKVVITNNINTKAYADSYGDCALVIANCETTFKTKLEWLLGLSEKDMLYLQNQSREWVVNKHSYQATGNKLIKLLSK